MHSGVFVIIIFLYVPGMSLGSGLNNNACKNYGDYPIWFWSKNCYYNPNVLSDTPAMIQLNGYPVEGHTITSEDGYILNIFRIPPLNNKRNKQPVFLMHGVLTTNAVWVHNGNQSLAFFLADEGYDVWLGAVRGTPLSKRHIKLRSTNANYWDFTLDSIAKYDVSQQLRMVSEITGKEGSIIYIGHSMGTTLSFMYGSGKPTEAHRLLAGVIGLAPVVYLNDISLIQNLNDVIPLIKTQLEMHNISALTHQESVNIAAIYICTTFPFFCKNILEMSYGNLTGQFLPEYLLLHFGHFPTGVSVKVLLHFEQIARTGQFKSYGCGSKENLERCINTNDLLYYDLANIKYPVYLFYGKNDILSTERNVEKLLNELGSAKKSMHHIPRNHRQEPFNHLDFILAKDARTLLYDELLKTLEELKK